MSVSDEFGWTILSIVASALLSGLLGVLISNWYYKRSEIRRIKLRILQQLMGNRFDLHSRSFVEALNQVPVVFYESNEVLSAFKTYQEHCQTNSDGNLGVQRFHDLINAMYKHLDMNTEPLTDNIFRATFTTK
jgi:hypothetical protein